MVDRSDLDVNGKYAIFICFSSYSVNFVLFMQKMCYHSILKKRGLQRRTLGFRGQHCSCMNEGKK